MHCRNTTNQVFIASAASAALSAVLFAWLFLSIKHMNEDVFLQTDALQSASAEEARLTAASRVLDEISIERTTLQQATLLDKEIVPFLESLENLARENSAAMTITAIEESFNSALPERFKLLVVQTEITGRWEDVYRFTQLMERLPQRIVIDQAVLERPIDTESNFTRQTWRGDVRFSIAAEK